MVNIHKKRFVVDIPKSMHEELMEIARKRNITLTQLFLVMATERILQERQYDNVSTSNK